jgi:hypothetical protein
MGKRRLASLSTASVLAASANTVRIMTWSIAPDVEARRDLSVPDGTCAIWAGLPVRPAPPGLAKRAPHERTAHDERLIRLPQGRRDDYAMFRHHRARQGTFEGAAVRQWKRFTANNHRDRFVIVAFCRLRQPHQRSATSARRNGFEICRPLYAILD